MKYVWAIPVLLLAFSLSSLRADEAADLDKVNAALATSATTYGQISEAFAKDAAEVRATASNDSVKKAQADALDAMAKYYSKEGGLFKATNKLDIATEAALKNFTEVGDGDRTFNTGTGATVKIGDGIAPAAYAMSVQQGTNLPGDGKAFASELEGMTITDKSGTYNYNGVSNNAHSFTSTATPAPGSTAQTLFWSGASNQLVPLSDLAKALAVVPPARSQSGSDQRTGTQPPAPNPTTAPLPSQTAATASLPAPPSPAPH